MGMDWNFPGSKWWKFDFHTHTPGSEDYGRGDASCKNIEPEEWLQKAMDAEIDCVLVTDHNSGGWIDLLNRKNRALKTASTKPIWYRELTIFPGAEITVADSNKRVHLLAVFDPCNNQCDSQKITSVLKACGITSGFGDDRETGTTISFIETVRKIEDAGGIAIPAHIDGPRGLLEDVTSLTPELNKSLAVVFAAEFCIMHQFDNADPPLKKAVGRLAQVAGSNAHKPEDIGRHYSWLKMSCPSLDGLRLALLDHEYCVKNQKDTPNHQPDVFLSRLTIKNMRHCGRKKNQPFIADFHPHFNSIIGGRGTGKSTILESIRIAMRRDQALKTEAPRVKEELDKFMMPSPKGIMLDDTEILLELHRRGRDYQLCWRYDGQGAVFSEKTEHDWVEIESGNLIERLPVSIFSQKQINELASNPRGLLEIVDHASEIGREKWNGRWESLKNEFMQLTTRKRELLRQLSEENDIRARLGDVENDLRQYEEKGHGRVLKEYQKRNQQKNSLPDDRLFDDLATNIRELAAEAEWPDFPAHLFDALDQTTTGIKKIHENTAFEFQKISQTLGMVADRVDALKDKRASEISASKWHQAVQDGTAAYQDLVKAYKDKKSPLSLSLYGEWVQQRNQLQSHLKSLDAVRIETETINARIGGVKKKLLDLRRERFEKRISFIKKVIGGSDFVRMELVPFGDVSTLEEDYRSILNLDRDKFISSVCDPENKNSVLLALYHWENTGIPEADLPRLISNIKSITWNIATGSEIAYHGAFINRLTKLLKDQPAVFDQLEVWWPEDLLRVKYAKDPASGKFEDLEKGSAGQKAAAILAFLLSHGDEPLIIDQPEDDLDNALIYDLIVSQVHENKEKRQLIIVTHNPNIVVNGDSELVHVLKFERGQVQIEVQGGLEESKIREAICNIMEGGRQAFEKRYKRITAEV